MQVLQVRRRGRPVAVQLHVRGSVAVRRRLAAAAPRRDHHHLHVIRGSGRPSDGQRACRPAAEPVRLHRRRRVRAPRHAAGARRRRSPDDRNRPKSGLLGNRSKTGVGNRRPTSAARSGGHLPAAGSRLVDDDDEADAGAGGKRRDVGGATAPVQPVPRLQAPRTGNDVVDGVIGDVVVVVVVVESAPGGDGGDVRGLLDDVVLLDGGGGAGGPGPRSTVVGTAPGLARLRGRGRVRRSGRPSAGHCLDRRRQLRQ